MSRKPIVVANWKMNGCLKDNLNWFNQITSQQLPNIEIAVAPSFVYLAQAQQCLAASKIGWGAQDVSEHANGAFTGQVSVDMVKDFGGHYVIIGHSERRAMCSECDELVAIKTKKVLNSGLTAIVCVGETLEQRESGKTNQVVARQLNTVLELCKNDDLSKLVVAYEPVWAIGTGLNASPEQAEEVHSFLRQQIAECVSTEVANSTRIMYGGSVKPSNAAQLFAKENIDGGLIGGASLDATSFYEICLAAE